MNKPFNPDDVKTGNYGEEKAKIKIDEAREKHQAAAHDKAALHPYSGEVCAISFQDS